MYLIVIGGYCLALGLGALLYKYITDKPRRARKQTTQRPF
jgi:predicted membrane-bound spermidine synthase